MSHEQNNHIDTIYLCPDAEHNMFHALEQEAYIIITLPDGAILVEKFIGKSVALCMTSSDRFEEKRWYAIDPEMQKIIDNAFDANKSIIALENGTFIPLRSIYQSTLSEEYNFKNDEIWHDDADMFFDYVLKRIMDVPTQFLPTIADGNHLTSRHEFRLNHQIHVRQTSGKTMLP